MTSSPLARRREEPSLAGYDQLVAHIEKLNNNNWVVSSGKLYYLASRTLADGRVEHFVDRHV